MTVGSFILRGSSSQLMRTHAKLVGMPWLLILSFLQSTVFNVFDCCRVHSHV